MGENIPGRILVRGDVAVLAREITDLAGLRLAGIAWWFLAPDVWVLVSQGSGAVTVRGNRLVMDVVD